MTYLEQYRPSLAHLLVADVVKMYQRFRSSIMRFMAFSLVALASAIGVGCQAENLPSEAPIEAGEVTTMFNPDTLDALGVAGADIDQVIPYSTFTIGYDYERKHALYVGYRIVPELVGVTNERKNTFHEEQRIPAAYRTTLDDYYRSGYDRGHLAPRATLDQTDETMHETFSLANMSPQQASFNRYDWADLENFIRECVYSYDNGEALFVFTGPYFAGDHGTIGASQIPIPSGYYKVVFEFNDGDASAFAVQAPHFSFDFDRLSDYVVTVDHIESLTNLDFGSLLPEVLEQQLESTTSPACAI